MHLENIILSNFRNFIKAEIEFGDSLNFLIGENGQGKSNILEAIHLLLTFRSLRASYYQNMINWKSNFFYLKGTLVIDNKSRVIEVVGERDKGKRLRINNNVQANCDYRFPVVVFTTENYNIIKGAPSDRRNYLDFQISQIDQQYLYNLRQYEKVLTQKNLMLQDGVAGKNIDLLDLWDKQLVEYGVELITRRSIVVCKMRGLIRKFYEEMMLGEDIGVGYRTFLPDSVLGNRNEMIDIYSKSILKMRDEEIKKGFSLCGPHRDDIVFLMNGKDSKSFSSQGQIKSILLALNLAEIYFVFEEAGEYPIVLFDELFSELDNKRIEKIFSVLPKDIQIFVTEVDESKVSGKNGEWFRVDNGNVSVV